MYYTTLYRELNCYTTVDLAADEPLLLQCSPSIKHGPANMRRWPTVGLLSALRLRRWPNSKSTLGAQLEITSTVQYSLSTITRVFFHLNLLIHCFSSDSRYCLIVWSNIFLFYICYQSSTRCQYFALISWLVGSVLVVFLFALAVLGSKVIVWQLKSDQIIIQGFECE